MFDRLTDGPLMMLHGCSLTRETDDPLGVSNGRLTDWTYCTQAPQPRAIGMKRRGFIQTVVPIDRWRFSTVTLPRGACLAVMI